MLIVHVFVEVKPDGVDAFRTATIQNAIASRQEAGVVTFDALAQEGAPTKYLLVEVYRDEAAAAAHKQTAHYATWRDAVASLMAQPRFSVRYNNLLDNDAV